MFIFLFGGQIERYMCSPRENISCLAGCRAAGVRKTRAAVGFPLPYDTGRGAFC